eukprot:gnl/TRDRNA2_/TRDRNA2_169809_c1_seq1.p1 gnl/TRDRNA2_/TRDRNA2_169809_c1~~gnl/TRDRNA2_/TRDRNA2_169809_c1_seq1.p1  ORF type:complete len:112 (-),score=10.82 gnl/TRDRNA2_/TRDRNA2_169809_c1_seq1:29-364(-)
MTRSALHASMANDCDGWVPPGKPVIDHDLSPIAGETAVQKSDETDGSQQVAEHAQEEDEPCEICGSREDPGKSLLCDTCNKVYHTYCVGLISVPAGEWHCPRCISVRPVIG